MRLIDHQDNLDLWVNIKQSLDEETVGDFIFLSFVVLETRAVVKREIINSDLVGNGGFRELIMPNFDDIVLTV